MKYLSLMLCIFFIISACNGFDSDSNQTEIKDIDIVNVELIPGEIFVFSLGFLGDEEQAVIKKDSQNAEVSELIRDFDVSVTVEYRYQSKTDFEGRDSVVLEVRRGSDGESPNNEIYYTVLHFNVQPSS